MQLSTFFTRLCYPQANPSTAFLLSVSLWPLREELKIHCESWRSRMIHKLTRETRDQDETQNRKTKSPNNAATSEAGYKTISAQQIGFVTVLNSGLSFKLWDIFRKYIYIYILLFTVSYVLFDKKGAKFYCKSEATLSEAISPSSCADVVLQQITKYSIIIFLVFSRKLFFFSSFF